MKNMFLFMTVLLLSRTFAWAGGWVTSATVLQSTSIVVAAGNEGVSITTATFIGNGTRISSFTAAGLTLFPGATMQADMIYISSVNKQSSTGVYFDGSVVIPEDDGTGVSQFKARVASTNYRMIWMYGSETNVGSPNSLYLKSHNGETAIQLGTSEIYFAPDGNYLYRSTAAAADFSFGTPIKFYPRTTAQLKLITPVVGAIYVNSDTYDIYVATGATQYGFKKFATASPD